MRFCDLAQIENLLDVLDNGRQPTDLQRLKARKAVNRESRILNERSVTKKRNLARAQARAIAEY